MRAFLIITLALLSIPALAVTTDSKPLREVRLALQWADQAQFAGAYMAESKGYFEREGLRVKFLSGEVKSSLTQVQDGEADFAISMLCSALQRAHEGKKLILVFQIVRHSNLALIAYRNPLNPTDTPILTPQDIGNRPISIWQTDFRRPYEIFLIKNGLVKPNIIPQYGTISLFLRKGVYAYSGMTYSELNLAYQHGIPQDRLNVFLLRDYGIDFPEDGLYCRQSLYRQDPELVRRMARALKAGWEDVEMNREAALDVVMKRVIATDRITNRAQMTWMLKTILPSIFPDKREREAPFGVLPRKTYNAVVAQLRGFCGFQNLPAYDDFVMEVANEPLP